MQIQENISLKAYNTFGIDARARFFAAFHTADELLEFLNRRPALTAVKGGQTAPVPPPLILGGGSNILFTRDVDGLVLKNEMKGIEVVSKNDDAIYIKAGAGENWHQFVLYCIEKGWSGIENLSLIPGNVGASPMQNIGAYGVEIKEVFHELKAFHIQEKTNYTFALKDCEFGYRESIFKRRYKDQFVILNVTYRLTRKPTFNINYGALEQELDRMGVRELSSQAVSQAVINIRTSKLPDPAIIGNAGSFFKNPTITGQKFLALKTDFPGLVGYPNPDGSVKLAAGWLIEQCGWKGIREGDAGVHVNQALVLVNYQNASGQEIFRLSEKIIDSVREKFGVSLEREVNIV